MLAMGDSLTLWVHESRSASIDGSGDGFDLIGPNDVDDGYVYSSEYGYVDDFIDYGDSVIYDGAASGTEESAVLYFPAQTGDIQLMLTRKGSSDSEVVSIVTDQFPSHGHVYGSTINLQVTGFTDNLGRECRNGVLIREEESCVSVPSEICTDIDCCRGMVCTVMPRGPKRCRIASVPGLGLVPTHPPSAIPEPTKEPYQTPKGVPFNASIIVGITLAIAALLVLVGIIIARTYKRDDDYGNKNNKIVLTLDDDCTTVYASEGGWESSQLASRNHSRLEGKSSTGYSAYSNMPHNPPPGRRAFSRSSDLAANHLKWKQSSSSSSSSSSGELV